MHGFSSREENDIWEIVEKYAITFKAKWYEYFNK